MCSEFIKERSEQCHCSESNVQSYIKGRVIMHRSTQPSFIHISPLFSRREKNKLHPSLKEKGRKRGGIDERKSHEGGGEECFGNNFRSKQRKQAPESK